MEGVSTVAVRDVSAQIAAQGQGAFSVPWRASNAALLEALTIRLWPDLALAWEEEDDGRSRLVGRLPSGEQRTLELPPVDGLEALPLLASAVKLVGLELLLLRAFDDGDDVEVVALPVDRVATLARRMGSEFDLLFRTIPVALRGAAG